MKKISRILSAMLAMLLLLSVVTVITSCNTTPAGGEDSGTSSDVIDTSDTDADIPELEVVDLDGMELTILWPEVHGDGHYAHNEITGASEGGDAIDLAVFARNAMVEKAYNVKILSETKFVSDIPGDYRKEAMNGAQPAFHAMVSVINNKQMTSCTIEGWLADFNKLDYYDEAQPWWNHELMEGLSISGARYFATGDIIYSDDFYPYCTYVNTDVSDALMGEGYDYYSLVKNKEWTLEKFNQLAAQAQSVPENNTAEPKDWANGAVAGAIVNENFAKAAYYAAGKGMITYNSAGTPIWQMTPTYVNSILPEIWGFIHNGKACFNVGGLAAEIGGNHAIIQTESFTADKCLFLVEELIFSERIVTSGNSVDFQILPFPLYEEGGEYRCVLNDAAVIAIPDLLDDETKDSVALVLSAMSRASMDTLTPAFFDKVLSSRYMGDAQSKEVLQIILNSTVAPDIATIYDWGGFREEFKRLAFATDYAGFDAYYDGNKGQMNKEITSYIDSLNKYYGN